MFNLTSAVLPVPTAPPTPVTRFPGSTVTATSAPVDLPYNAGLFASDIALYLNQLLAELANVGVYGGGVPGILGAFQVQGPLSLYAAYNSTVTYVVGQITSYMGQNYVAILPTTGNLPTNATYWATTTLGSVVTGAQVGILPGSAYCQGQLDYIGGVSACSYSTASVVYVWLQQSPWVNLTSSTGSAGTIQMTNTTTPPVGAPSLLLGTFPIASGVIGQFDYAGPIFLSGGMAIRYAGDRSGPVDSPSTSSVFHTITGGGLGQHFVWNGSNYYNLNPISNSASVDLTLTTTLQLLVADAGFVLNCIASGGNQVVLMPPTSSLPDQWKCGIWNVGGSYNVILKDSTGVTTLSTIAPGNGIYPYAYWNGSAIVLPGGAPWTASGRPTPNIAPQ